jgi:hypothetical protein
MKKEWQDTINWDEFSVEKLNFCFQESKDALKCSLKNADELDKKSFVLLSIFLTFLTLISLISGFMLKQDINLQIFSSLIILLIGSLVSFSYIIKSLKTYKYDLIGNSASNLIASENGKHDYNHLLSCELLSYDNRIKKAVKNNKNKGGDINIAICVFFATIILSSIVNIAFKFPLCL